ncbi:OsmC family protein [Flavobacterium sp. 102]|uniref:OsmC family protein n=1 Tax=Flavobacterium sp. 102 TaxID=2135623 RepID=UPI000EB2149D|nr:OsmC family protein [Flavobacterium sp. 102]RKS03615.1 organic hydroperoxide reductase OsmC/OhrA [Flavobacterium sp. 102]
MENILSYQVKTTWKESRVGEISSPVLNNVIEVATPPEFAKGIAGLWSPEHLLAGAVSSCFMTTFLAVAEKMRMKFIRFDCTATLFLERTEGKLNAIQITIHPTITVSNSHDSGKGLKVLDVSAKSCIISNMLKPEITIIPQIIVEMHRTV